MKRLFFYFSYLLICSNIIYAQKIDVYEPATLEVEYYRRMVTDTLDRDKDFIGGKIRLRIGKNMSMNYDPQKMWYDSIDCYNKKLGFELFMESVGNKKKNHESLIGHSSEIIYKDFKKNKVDFYYASFGDWHYTEKLEIPQWFLQDSTKNILDYTCQLAKCNFRGRTWYAWFTLDIPISDGPWKLCGLPGLILEAYDSDRDYTFIAKCMWQEGIPNIGLYNYKEREWITTTRFQYLKIKHRNINTNQAALYSNMYNLKLKSSETNAKPKHRNYDLEERDYHDK